MLLVIAHGIEQKYVYIQLGYPEMVKTPFFIDLGYIYVNENE